MIRFFRIMPLFLLIYFSMSEFNTEFDSFSFLSFNLQYILIYFWVLKRPQLIGYGFIFLAGIFNDVIQSNPIGLSALTYLLIASSATYIRHVTVRVSLITDWIAFFPTVIIGNIFYYITINFFHDLTISYLSLLMNSVVTIMIYPLFWLLFIFMWNLMRIKNV